MLVYKQYNQVELDRQYNNRLHVPDFKAYLIKWENLSRQAEKRYPVIKDIPYGNLSRECLDVFPSAKQDSKTLIFIHGGYWQMFDKSSFYFVAGAFASYGITTVLINYPFATSVSMDQTVASCHKALLWLHKNITQLKGDPEHMYLAGHSAGAHLAAMVMTKEEAQRDNSVIQGICMISGIFNLIPIQLSKINEVLQMDQAMAIKNSPSQAKPAESYPLVLITGTDETDEFRNQSRELYTIWKINTSSIELLEAPGMNHFSILDSVLDSGSTVHIGLRKLMKV